MIDTLLHSPFAEVAVLLVMAATIGLLSELGIAVLLFLVGITLDVKLIRSLGRVALMTGLGQVLFNARSSE